MSPLAAIIHPTDIMRTPMMTLRAGHPFLSTIVARIIVTRGPFLFTTLLNINLDVN